MSENSFSMKTWEEQVVSGADDGPRYAHARATFSYRGIIEGTSTCDYLLYYDGTPHNGGQRAPGFERIAGSVEGRQGSFVIRHDVAYGPEGIQDRFAVVAGSGTGELAGISGCGTAAGSQETVAYTFDYTLDGSSGARTRS